MSFEELFAVAGNYPLVVIGYFVGVPLVALLVGWRAAGKGEQNPWRYVYAVLVYLACVPGILALTVCGYALFMRQNLLQANVLVYFLPIVSMVVGLVIMRRNVDMNKVPGFDRLSGLVYVLLATSITLLVIDKLHFVAWFRGSIFQLVLMFLVLFGLFKWGESKLLRSQAAVEKMPE